MRVTRLVVVALESAADEGRHAEHVKPIARHANPGNAFRIAGAGVATEKSDSSSSSLTGSVGWTPIQNLHGDVGAYFQSGAQGPAARVRYQLLNQFAHGLDLAGGMRFKTVGFHPDQGEVELLLAAGRRFGQFEVVLNGVFGFETGGENGKDVEAKAFAGWRFNEAVRAGIDGRLQAEVSDEATPATPIGPPTVASVRDYDLTAGPTVAWMVTRTIQVQGLVGVAQPKKTDKTSPVGVIYASIDF